MPKSRSGSQTPPSNRRKIDLADFGECVDVLVGEDEERVTVHKKILCRTSTFFQAACNGEWREAQQRTVTLETAEPELFSIYLNWLYTGQVAVYPNEQTCTEEGHPACRAMEPLMHSHVLGDFLGDLVYCNALTDEMIKVSTKYDRIPSVDFIEEMWPHLAKQSGFRRLLVDFMALEMTEEDIDDVTETLPRDLFAEITKSLVKARRLKERDYPGHQPKGHYHDKVREPARHNDEAEGAASDLNH